MLCYILYMLNAINLPALLQVVPLLSYTTLIVLDAQKGHPHLSNYVASHILMYRMSQIFDKGNIDELALKFDE